MRVLIDTDPGLGIKFRDVDDGLALFLMLNNEQFEIEGITTVFGNTPVDIGYLLLRKYLKLTNNINIPHKKGAVSRKDLGILNPASRLLIKTVKESPNELILITLGPLTNIATALKHYPEFFDNLKQIVMMGGTLSPLSVFNPHFKSIDRRFFDKIKIKALVAEFNFFNDPIATKMIIEKASKTSRIEMGLDVCCQAVFTKKNLKQLEAHNHLITQFITLHIKHWLKTWRFNGKKGFFPFDTFCPIYLLEPNLFKTKKLFLDVDAEKVEGKLSICKNPRPNSAPITYCTNFINFEAKEKFMDILISNLKF